VFFVLKILFFSNRPGKVVGIRRNGTNNKNIDDTFQNKIIFFSRHFFVKKNITQRFCTFAHWEQQETDRGNQRHEEGRCHSKEPSNLKQANYTS
jgi:hypothetical protein